jgi:Hydrazine synthase alpha subunit middle domain
MRSLPRILAAIASIVMLIPICGFAPDAARKPSFDVDIIVTVAPVYKPLAALRGGERFPNGAQLMLVRMGKATPLIKEFAATADANVSFDAKRVIFAGKQTGSDPWQIWELTIENHLLRKLIAGSGDVIRPFYLPAGRLVYTRLTARGFQIEAAGKDGLPFDVPVDSEAGSKVLSLTHIPASAVPVDVLQDGRILFEAGFPLGTGSTPELFLVYSDGSGVESYRCDHGKARWGGRQLASGDVVFTHGNSLAQFTSPLATEAHIVAPRAEYAGAIAETASGDWLMSARAGARTHYALNLWKPGSAILQKVLTESDEDIVDPVLVAPRTRPKRHPSGLHDWTYANMMALDARVSREGDLKAAPASVRLETLDTSGHAVVTGTAPVERDGSFFVRTPADRPIRFALLDQKGAIIRQEQGWFWIRRGEQRICVGCHAGPERSSENRVPMVLERTTTPVDLSGENVLRETQHVSRRGN